jgi:hypothetical protein
MKIKRKTKVLRRFDDIADGHLVKQLGNKVKLYRSTGYMVMECPICHIMFDRKASEAKRHENNYCGRGCSGFAQRKQVDKFCIICGQHFTVKKSMESRITTCGNNRCVSKAISDNTKKGWKNKIYDNVASYHHCKLSNNDILKIEKDPRCHSIIAQEFGVTRSNISRIKRKQHISI